MMKRKTRVLLVVMSALLIAGLFVSCSGAADTAEEPADVVVADETVVEESDVEAVDAALQEKLDTTLYVGVSVRTFANPYLVTIADGGQLFADWLDEIGQKYEFEVMLNEGSNDEQINAIGAFLAKANGNAILFVDPNEAAIAATIADMVEEAGAYMGTTWNKPPEVKVSDYDHWIAHHTPDDVKMGYDIAVEMFSQFDTPFEGKVVAIQGLLGNTTANNRYAGLVKALEEYPGVELVADETAKWMAPEALTIMETLLVAHDDIDGVWCANDNMAMGVLQALEAKGLLGQVKVVGINAIPAAVDAIKAGNMTATVDCDGWGQGGYTLAMAYDAWLGNLDVPALPEDHRQFGTASIFINDENVDWYIANYIEQQPVMDFTNYWEFRAGDYPID